MTGLQGPVNARPGGARATGIEGPAQSRSKGPLGQMPMVETSTPGTSSSSLMAGSTSPLSWGWQAIRRRMPLKGWRTFLAVLVVLMFPRLIALCIAVIFRLLIRAIMSLCSHLFREVWLQLQNTATELEDALVEWLHVQLGLAGPYVPAPAMLTTGAPPAPPQQQQQGGNSLPARPMDFVTCVLLVLNLRRPLGGGGGYGVHEVHLHYGTLDGFRSSVFSDKPVDASSAWCKKSPFGCC